MATTGIQKLQNVFNSLSEDGRRSLLDYAMFLKSHYPAEISLDSAPKDIQRPEQESVVLAIRRLSETYPMLDRQALLHDTASFMMQHVMQGREACQVIDDLEDYFRQQYESFCKRQSHV